MGDRAELPPLVEQMIRRQNEVIDSVCWEAMEQGYTVRVTHYWAHVPYIGIELRPGPVQIEYFAVWP